MTEGVVLSAIGVTRLWQLPQQALLLLTTYSSTIARDDDKEELNG